MKIKRKSRTLTVTGELEMDSFVKDILCLAEEKKISMEVMNVLPAYLKKALKKNNNVISTEDIKDKVEYVDDQYSERNGDYYITYGV